MKESSRNVGRHLIFFWRDTTADICGPLPLIFEKLWIRPNGFKNQGFIAEFNISEN